MGSITGATISYKTSPWRIWLWTADGIIGLFIAVMIAVMALRTKKSNAHPELYRAPKAKKAK